MPVKLVPKSQADVTLALRALFVRTEQELINIIKRKKNLNQVDYAETAALMRVQQTLNQMVAKSNEYVPKMVERIFYETAKDFSGYTNATSLTVSQTGVVDVIVNNLLGEVEEMAQEAAKTATEQVTIGRLEADKYRQAGLLSVAEKEAAGASWRTAAERMNQRLQAEGITCFVDKAGRRWSMNAYGNMVARTTARQAQVAAILTADDHDLYQISKIGSTCPICAVYEGRVYSKSGSNPEYPPLAMAFGKIDPLGSNDLSNTYLNIHPNCLHTLMKYTTMGLSDKQIQKDKDFSSFEKNPVTHDPRTKKQIEAYKEKERNRQKLRQELKKKEIQAIGEQGISGKKETATYNNAVDLEYINSHEFTKKFEGVTNNAATDRQIAKYSKAILEHRNGTDKEDLYVIRMSDGKFVTKGTGTNKSLAIEYTNKMNAALAKYSDERLLSIHNHPSNLPPTGSDFGSAFKHGYSAGIIQCHNGDTYYYTVGSKRFSSYLFDNKVSRLEKSGYNKYDAMISVLNDYSKQYGITWRKI